MERLTEKRDGQNVIPLRQYGKNIWELTVAGMGDASTQFSYRVYANKLAEYEDLDEQGLLLRLPCKVGTEVWTIMCGMTGKHPILVKQYFELSMLQYWGKAVFLTKAEAEQKLKEMERGNNGTME